MVQFRALDNRTSVAKQILALEQKIEGFRNKVFIGMATSVVQRSPVDTGTYMDSHSVGIGRNRSGPITSSRGKPRGQNRSPYESAALARLIAQINALPPLANPVYFKNNAEHARYVEYGPASTNESAGNAYRVYQNTRSELPEIVARVSQ